jgi:hypothetical protein
MDIKRDAEAVKAMREMLALSQSGKEKNKTVSMRIDPELKKVVDEVVRLRRMQTGEDIGFSDVVREFLHNGLEEKLSQLEKEIKQEKGKA